VLILFAEKPRKPFKVKVFSTTGSLLREAAFNPSDNAPKLDLSDLPTGVYAVQLNSSEVGVKGSGLVRVSTDSRR
jgi:hypothetical protein